ncbi:Ig-like domain-containing protein, partial [Vogesella indigofera]|uniref:Ig-like domain-containing protein n=1 Tax=Vogesella indigofera TaxID=45465 RepID=UPI00234F3AD5
MAISSVSYTKTPQAGDDSYWYTEDELLAASNYDSGSNVLTLNVMSNDLGGNAKKLYSIDDGSGALADLLARDVSTNWEATQGGNWIRINAGKIEFKFVESLDSLVQGQARQDSFKYAIQLGNGTISYATVSVTVVGSNDGPRVSAAVTSAGIEGGADFEVDLLQGASDIDQGETATLQTSGLSFSVNGGAPSSTLPAGLTLVGNKLLVDADGSAFDHLAAGATEVITVSYVVVDEHGASVAQTATITITGTNDGPVAVADTGAGTENQTLSLDVLANDTDVDDGHVLSLVSASAPAGKGSASVVGGQLQFDPGADFDHLADGAEEQVIVSYTMKDEHGAESSSTVTITVTGTNDGPVAVADTAAGTENQTLSLDVLGNDTDADDGHVLSLVSASAPV